MDLVAPALPAVEGRVEPIPLDVLDGAIEREPRHHLRVREVATPAAHLPDPLVGLLPFRLEEIEERALDVPSVFVRGYRCAARRTEIEASLEVEHARDLAEDVEL